MWSFFKRYRALLGIAALFSLVINLALLAPSLFMLQVYDRVLTSSSVETLHSAAPHRRRLDAYEYRIGAGCAPNIEGLNLEAVGVEYDRRKGVLVNVCLQTTNPRVYAATDVCLDWKFTHTADFTARIVIQNALFLGRKKLSALTMPWRLLASVLRSTTRSTDRAP